MKNQTQPTLFASLLNSCVRFSFYAEIIKTSLGRAFAFLTLLAAIAAVSFTVYVHQVLLPSLDRASEKLPAITITNGKVSVETPGEVPLPSTLYADPQKILRIDLDLNGSGQHRSAPSDFDYTVVITKYTIVVQQLTGETHTFGLPYGFSLTIHKRSLHFFLDSWLWLILLMVFLGSFGFFWALKFLQAFVLTIPGLILWGILRRDLTYGKLYTICIYALAPATLLSVLLLWFNARFALPVVVLQYQWVVYFLIALEYVAGGLAATSRIPPQKPEEKNLTERMF